MMRAIRWLACAAILVLAVGWALIWTGAVQVGPGGKLTTGLTLPSGVNIGGPFALVDSGGRAVTDADFRGRWMVLYFGYSFCPDICPTELQTIANALDLLGPAAAKVAPVFVTIDPARDTPKVLAEYVALFDSRIVGLTGTTAQIAAIERAYRVYAERVDSGNNTEYLMNHSSFVYLVAPDGHFAALFRQGSSPREIADAILAHMGQAG